ncbi:MAG TPA: quinolinate synthase NadA [Desulfurella acetivorans]|nr:quinolinate synthase NadA [Desulfurella acetivorans]
MEEKIQSKITRLKKEKNAIILAHYYQRDEVQELADFIGDSLALSIEASKTDADIIVFCGVKFMAETAKILSPQKKVILPVIDAGCPLADMATAEKVLNMKNEIGDVSIVSYVNTNVDVKMVSDICCTSANAINVVKSLESEKILFVPDKYLGAYVQKFVKDKEIYLFDGYCLVHDSFNKQDIEDLLSKHPYAKVCVHPESPMEVIELADFVGSTAGIINYCIKNNAKEFIIATESGIVFELKRQAPDKTFYTLGSKSICANMKKTTLKDVLNALEREVYEIILTDEQIQKAKKPIERMISIKRQ